MTEPTKMFQSKVTLLVLFSLLFQFSLASNELNFHWEGKRQKFPKGTLFLWEPSGEPGWHQYQKNKTHFNDQIPSKLSNQNNALWIKIPIDNITEPNNFFIDIPNSHINRAQAYYLNHQDQLIDSTHVFGDHIAFIERPLLFPEFIFPLNNAEIKYILLYLDKRNEPFFTSVQWLNQKNLETRKTEYYLLSGILLGVLIAAFIINLYIVLNAKNVLNYLYTIFLGLSIIYVLSDFGYLHWLINYHSHWIIDIIRPLSLSIAFPIYLFFFLNTVSFQKYYPKWAKRIRIYGWIWLIYVLMASSISPLLYDHSYKYYSLAISLAFQQLTLVIVITSSIFTLRKKDHYAIPFLITCSLFLITHFQYLAHRFGYVDDTVIQQHFVPIILSMDCLIMGGIVALRFIEFIQKNKALEFALLNKDKELGARIADIQLKELSRISQLLHNHIGMELMGLKNNIENSKNEIPEALHHTLSSQTSALIEDVRNTAHFLSPQVLRKFGLAHCIHLFVKETSKSQQIKHHVEITPQCNDIATNIQLVVLLIVQECLNNTIKHAHASEIQLQCFIENDYLYITYQDNGIGINNNDEKNNGIGILQITEMIHVCRGVCHIEGKTGEGFQLHAEIPIEK